MSVPLRIHGPAIVQFGGVSYYFKNGLKGSIKRNTTKISVDAFGDIAEVAKDCVVEFTGTPVGQIGSFAQQFPFGPGDIGKSVFGNSDTTLIVWTKNDGAKTTWKRGAITKTPGIKLSATGGTIYSGDMTFSCLMASDFDLANAHAWNTAATLAFNDATFDATKVRMARYTAAFGDSPYDAMLAQEGFDLEYGMSVENISVDNYGVIDIVLKSLEGTAKFKPADLTEAQMDTLIGLQDTTALLPGDVIGDAGTDLVISSSLLTVTLHSAGAKDSALMYQTGKLRADEIAFTTARTFTTGVPDPIFTFTLPG